MKMSFSLSVFFDNEDKIKSINVNSDIESEDDNQDDMEFMNDLLNSNAKDMIAYLFKEEQEDFNPWGFMISNFNFVPDATDSVQTTETEETSSKSADESSADSSSEVTPTEPEVEVPVQHDPETSTDDSSSK